MMVDNLNLSTLISQIPEAQKLHHTQLAHPEVQQALAQEAVLRRQRLEKDQVAKSEASAADAEVDPGERRRHPHEPEFESDQGHLIDTQV